MEVTCPAGTKPRRRAGILKNAPAPPFFWGDSSMSLNCAEIEAVISELDIVGSHIQQVYQPSYDTIVLELYGQGKRRFLLLSVAASACRIHEVRQLPARNERPLRFMECLKSRIRGATVTSINQIAMDRIVRIRMSLPAAPLSAEPPASAPPVAYSLYIRLWSSAGTMLLVDEDNVIVDALFRKPDKEEVSGAPCRIEADYASGTVSPNARKFSVREFPGEGSLSERIDTFYANRAGDLSRENLLGLAQQRYDRKSAALAVRRAEFEKLRSEYAEADRYRQIGDILMAATRPVTQPATRSEDGERSQDGMAPAKPGERRKGDIVECFDFYRNETLFVRIDPAATLVENARHYYEKYRKAASGLDDILEELRKIDVESQKLDAWLLKIKSEQDPFAMAKALQKAGTVREKPLRRYACLSLEDKGWTMLVGRSGKENDELLRHEVRGSDLWLHARDYSGSYVFIKAQKNKTFPLDIMIDAARLAIYYSKARKNLRGNVYYTFVKYLRRAKDGPKGLVIPTLEKNLFVDFDESEIKDLLDQTNGGD